MDYPVQVWYGVYFSGKGADTPPLPSWVLYLLADKNEEGVTEELRRRGYEGDDLVWVNCGDENYGLAVAESFQASWTAGEVTDYPADIFDTWAAQMARALAALEIGVARITWYPGAV